MSNDIYENLSAIGIRVTANHPDSFVDIEKTIYTALSEVSNDDRIFSLLCSWVKVHGEYVIIEKLIALEKRLGRLDLLGALAIYACSLKIHKWKRLLKTPDKFTYIGDPDLAEAAIEYRGVDEIYKCTNYRISSGSIRIRDRDVFSKDELSKFNKQYQNRLLFGANLRSDIITLINLGYDKPYQISKELNCNTEPALRVFKEYQAYLSSL